MVETGIDRVKFLDYTKSNDFYFFEVGFYNARPGYSYGPVVRPRTIFHYVAEGRGTLILNDKEFHVEAGQGFLIPAKTKAYYCADIDDPWKYSWMHIDGPRSMELFSSAGISEDDPVFIPNGDSTIIRSLMEDMFNNSDRECYCYGKVYEFFEAINSLSTKRVEIDVDPRLAYVKSAISFIRLKYSEDIGVEDVAAACGLNRSYLTRVFKHATGYTPQSYLMTYRVKKATELLLESTESVSSIAFLVGYSDAFTFSKAFKREKGISPSEYRKQHGIDV